MVKQFVFRGVDRTFSNRYHFSGSAPSDSTHWTTLSDAIVTAEKAIYQSYSAGGVKIVETFGYAAGSEVPVFSKTYTTDGTLAVSAAVQAPGDCAVLVRYSTAARTSKNHPLYLFNYYHGVMVQNSNGAPDTVWSSQRTAIGTYASSWVTGFSDGSSSHHRTGPNGDDATGSLVESLVTHRDLPH